MLDDPSELVAETDAPTEYGIETLDVRAAGPPEPLQRTLERLTDLSDDAVLVQLNDRAPQHLFPQLEDRGFAYDTVERSDATVTAIWPEE